MQTEIQLFIDDLTPCIIHQESGEIYDTTFSPLTPEDLDEFGRPIGWGNSLWGENSFDCNPYLHSVNVTAYK